MIKNTNNSQVILYPKLLPFALECMKERPGTIVQEDKAPSHAHHAQQAVYDAFKIARMLWPGNSPDLNMIEPAWPYLKRRTTSRGAPRTTKNMEAAWNKAWKDLPQDKIQRWIERIPRHLEQIRRCKS